MTNKVGTNEVEIAKTNMQIWEFEIPPGTLYVQSDRTIDIEIEEHR